MRLYIKFFVLLLAALSVDQFALKDPNDNELWFNVRCQFADITDDVELRKRLIVEAQRFVERDREEAWAQMMARHARVNASRGS